MVVEVNTSTLVPLLLLVVITITQVTRNINSRNYMNVEGWKVGPTSWYNHPKIGVVTYLHISINIILFITMSIIIGAYEGNLIAVYQGNGQFTIIGLFLIIILVWLVIPLLEFSEYQYIEPDDGHGHPESIGRHIGFVFLLTTISVVGEVAFRLTEVPTSIFDIEPLRLIGPISMIVVFLLIPHGTLHFLDALASEIEDSRNTVE